MFNSLYCQVTGDKSNGDDDIAEEEEYEENMMEVQPDIIMNEGEDDHFDSIVEEEGVDPIQG